jgi:hypothetical protein
VAKSWKKKTINTKIPAAKREGTEKVAIYQKRLFSI